ncbi:MAG: hypothetical protein ABSC48_12845 [Terracidiphilus sp.]|jgi:hypothetical protein
MTAPLRGTQSLVGQMGWVFERPSLTAIEVVWRWIFGVPFLAVCWIEAQRILAALPLESAGLTALDPQNPWLAASQLSDAWALYEPHVVAVLRWLLPAAALAWIVVSGLGRSLVLRRLQPRLAFRPLEMMVLQAAWLALFAAACWGWLRSMAWVAAIHITPAAEPDLVGYAMWAIFLSLGLFTLWALVSWAVAIAPLILLLEDCGVGQALARSLRLGRPMSAKLVEINLVMGIVKLALIVVAMVVSAAPLPFSDQLGPDTLHILWVAATVFFFVANDYFQVVRLKGFVEFWNVFRGSQAGGALS